MKRAALVLVLVTSACAATPTPTRDELTRALDPYGETTLKPTDLTHIACRRVDGYPTEFTCRWRQRDGRRWQGWQSYLSVSGGRWQLTTEPSRRP